jgi:hypothetical protein
MMHAEGRWWSCRIATAASLGVATTVAIAWFVAWWAGPTVTVKRQIDVPFGDGAESGRSALLECITTNGTGFRLVEIGSRWASAAPDMAINASTTRHAPVTIAGLKPLPTSGNAVYQVQPLKPEWPSWLPPVPSGPEHAYTGWSGLAVGWPVLCLSARWAYRFDPTTPVVLEKNWCLDVSAWAPRPSRPTLRRDWGWLPFKPIWSGFFLNTIVFGSFWLLPLIVPRCLTRWNRRRRGHCIDCGYDLRAASERTVCPECGSLASCRH